MTNDRQNQTTELVMRLRSLNACEPGCEGRCDECPNSLVRSAADEIERLRRLLWMIQDQGYHPSGYLKDMIEEAVKYA